MNNLKKIIECGNSVHQKHDDLRNEVLNSDFSNEFKSKFKELVDKANNSENVLFFDKHELESLKKITKTTKISEYEVLTDTGFVDIIQLKIDKIKTIISNKLEFNLPWEFYDVIVKDWDEDDDYGWFCSTDKVIFINKNIVNDDKTLEKVIYHEFLHLYLQCETKLFYDELRPRFMNLFFKYLNKYCSNYQVSFIDSWSDIMVNFKQTNDEGYKNHELLKEDKSISSNYGQFKMLSEFIIHNSDHYYTSDFNDSDFNEDLLNMNKFVLNLVKENIFDLSKKKNSIFVK